MLDKSKFDSSYVAYQHTFVQDSEEKKVPDLWRASNRNPTNQMNDERGLGPQQSPP
jgi:hypothetical protein